MEEKEVEKSSEQLQSLIADGVHKAILTSPGILKKYSLLKALLERRQRQATRFLELCESALVFENTVKELYSHLEWEYTELDSDSNHGTRTTRFRGSISRPPSSSVTTPQASSPENEENQEKMNPQTSSPDILNKNVKVVLRRLESSAVAATNCPASPDAHNEEDVEIISDESLVEWKPDGERSESESSDPDFVMKKKRKIKAKRRKDKKVNPSSKRRRQSAPKARKENTPVSTSNTVSYIVSDNKSSSSPETSDTDHEVCQQEATAWRSNSTKTAARLSTKKTETSQNHAKPATKTQDQSAPKAVVLKTTTKSNTANTTAQATKTPQSLTDGSAGKVIKTFTTKVGTPASEGTSKTVKITRIVPKGEIKVNMNVLARKKSMCWERGKVSEIITRESGKVKYKITFAEKGKVLVSGHHIAFDGLPRLEDLSLGCRVVVKCPNETFQPGILCELPSRKNRMRFLVYIDDHTPIYVSLRELFLVCRPLADPLEEIPDDNHRVFMQNYLKLWPYPHQLQIKVGETLKAEYKGVMQTCKIITADCSLIEVIFESDQHKEWLYRGSLRLEHMLHMNQKSQQNSTK
ncbi:histone-lysine N-methyltransferase SETDB1-A-like [Cyprinodon tularosa]|uniref:histone-lysine N-methyltransferase SETDB1-A-like n=1 Tax=Cyprinodon tularosa TaxID=77115 RepID=UPI0018E276DE|nr:histone-lysine N-methyltransferase SETDB1-A-like [Cyprinodon tularosa]